MTISREASNLESKKLPIKFRPPSNLSNSVNFVSKLLLTILLVTPELPFRRRIFLLVTPELPFRRRTIPPVTPELPFRRRTILPVTPESPSA